MKKENLPLHEECEERVKSGDASALDIFIYENEPAGNEMSELFRIQLADMLTEHARGIARIAWSCGIDSFAQEIGNDMSEEIECGIPIYNTIDDFINSEL